MIDSGMLEGFIGRSLSIIFLLFEDTLDVIAVFPSVLFEIFIAIPPIFSLQDAKDNYRGLILYFKLLRTFTFGVLFFLVNVKQQAMLTPVSTILNYGQTANMTSVQKQDFRKKLQIAETQRDHPKAAFTHLKQVGHNFVQLLLNFPLLNNWLQHCLVVK